MVALKNNVSAPKLILATNAKNSTFFLLRVAVLNQFAYIRGHSKVHIVLKKKIPSVYFKEKSVNMK